MLCLCRVGFSGHINRSGKTCSGEKLDRGHSRTEGLISFFPSNSWWSISCWVIAPMSGSPLSFFAVVGVVDVMHGSPERTTNGSFCAVQTKFASTGGELCTNALNCPSWRLSVHTTGAYRYVGDLIFYLAQKVKVNTVCLMLLLLPQSSPEMSPFTTFVLYTIEWWSLYGHVMKRTDHFVIVCLFKRCKTNQDPVLGDHGLHKCVYTTGMSLIYSGSWTVNGQSATCSDVPTGHFKRMQSGRNLMQKYYVSLFGIILVINQTQAGAQT